VPVTGGDHRYVALDGLRALAVLAVLVEHGFDVAPSWETDLFKLWAPGTGGVRLFFVLSGFLITGILLGARSAGGEQQRGHVLRAFYVRRALRIFPLAYATILGMVLISSAVRQDWLWFLSYTSNWRWVTGQFEGPLAHFWSLAIEEQFYLVWPALILWTPRRHLLPMMFGVILTATLSRYALAALVSPAAAYLSTVSRLDALAWGGVLAYWRRQGSQPRGTVWAGLGLAALAAPFAVTDPVVAVLNESAAVLLSGAIVMWAVDREPRLLRLPPLTYLGTISYGIYIMHPLMRFVVPVLNELTGLGLYVPSGPGVGSFMYMAVLATGVAAVSWRVFEKPLNDQKDRVPYVRRGDTADVITVDLPTSPTYAPRQ
jgi:peptidoglycan/LPS O-acetylase OafA/YrhL